VRLLSRKEGKDYTLAFVNFAEGTLVDKCKEMCRALDGSKPSWNQASFLPWSPQHGGHASRACALPSASCGFGRGPWVAGALPAPAWGVLVAMVRGTWGGHSDPRLGL